MILTKETTMRAETWSNAAYLILAISWAWQGYYELAALGAYLAYGSAVGHHFRNWLPDWAAMYSIMLGLLLHLQGLPVWLAIIAIAATYYYKPMVGNFSAIGVLWVAMMLSMHDLTQALIVAGIFALAFHLRQVGEQRRHQLYHSLWHLLTAIGFYLIP
jgi:hypothetical protein